MTNTNDVKTNFPQQGLVTDLHENLMSEKIWSYARNSTLNSHLGQVQFLQNEPSTQMCVEFPYTPIGFIKLLQSRWAVFSTDNRNSEIGIFDESTCTYQKLVNDRCLNFSTDSLIKGESKEMFDCSETIYWTDGRRNPRRYLNLSNVPYTYTIQEDNCDTKIYSDNLDCDELLIDKKITVPFITTSLSSGGSLKNGSYEFAIAYSVNKSRISDFYGITTPRSIWSHQNFGQAIDLQISSLDRDFNEYELIVISTVNESTSYKTIGWFPTSTTFHHISSIDRTEYESLKLEEITVKRPKYPYADTVEANDQYILWAGVQSNPELNYQIQAMKITSKYVVYQVPSDYYRKGGNIKGYQRDETYAFAIQWLFENGEWSDAFHIPGRKAIGVDLGVASGTDVYETTMRDVVGEQRVIKTWEVENTSRPMRRINSRGPEERVIAKGEMGYWESTEHYGDNTSMFGDDACTPIRHHLFPDECKAVRYGASGGYIHILGLEFHNIEYPKDADGKPVKGIVGYRIVRGNRRGNRRVMAKGVMTNVRNYTENGQEVLYTNYGYNDLRPDPYISSSQTKNGEGGSPLSGYKKDQFNFYSPETQFQHISLGNELAIYTEESSTVEGFFEHVYKHPKFKLLTQYDLYFALVVGALDGYYATKGKKCVTKVGKSNQEFTFGGGIETPSGPTIPTTGNQIKASHTEEQACDDALNWMSSSTVSGAKLNVAERILKGLASAGIFTYFTLKTANTVLDIITNALPYQDYSLQYNSHGLFNSSRCIERDNRRRYISHYQYIFDGMNTVLGNQYNNFKREENVFLSLNAEIEAPSVIDDTRRTLSGFGLCSDISAKVRSTASLMYVGVKRKLPNQYGQLDAIQYLDTNGDYVAVQYAESYTSPAIFGGDTYIGRMSTKRTHQFFSNTLTNTEDGFIFDYRNHRNVGFPIYWMDSTPYDLGELIVPRPNMSRIPKGRYNFDCTGNSDGISVVKNKYFYTSFNSVIEYFVESDINVDFRDWKNEEQSFYSSTNSNLTQLFRSDKIDIREEFVYDRSYTKELSENYIAQQRLDFDAEISAECLQYKKNGIIYSLPSFKDQKGDNWMVYLAANYYEFPQAKFGELTAIHGVDNQQIMFLFSKSSPYITIGRDELQTEGGTKITIGDGGLFAREPRPIAFTDHHYGSCQSGHAFINTQFGSFYPSQEQGRIFSYRGQLEEITQSGMSFWFKNYLPSKLLEDFPNYKGKDNPVSGVGLVSAFDSVDEKYYLSKKDYVLRASKRGKVRYDAEKNKFYDGAREAKLDNTEFFIDASWTISYDPKLKVFVSWHDWHPDYIIPTEKHFMSVKGKTAWKHNVRTDSFCNFYGTNYPFQIEYLANGGQNNQILRSIEYFLEVGKYFNEGRDFHMMLDDNFDYLTVSNNEQMSGPLRLVLQSKRDASTLLDYPRVDVANQRIDILYNKEEQKYRINQFTDIVKDRGEFSHKNFPLWITSPNGYIKDINFSAINFNKTLQMQKRFRNVWNKILLTRNISRDLKFIFKFANTKVTNSFR